MLLLLKLVHLEFWSKWLLTEKVPYLWSRIVTKSLSEGGHGPCERSMSVLPPWLFNFTGRQKPGKGENIKGLWQGGTEIKLVTDPTLAPEQVEKRKEKKSCNSRTRIPPLSPPAPTLIPPPRGFICLHNLQCPTGWHHLGTGGIRRCLGSAVTLESRVLRCSDTCTQYSRTHTNTFIHTYTHSHTQS